MHDTPLGVRLPLGILQMAGAVASDGETTASDAGSRPGESAATVDVLQCTWRSCGEVDPTILSSLDYVLSLDLPDTVPEGEEDDAGAWW